MRVHHLNCGTMCPHGGRLVSGEGGFGGARIVCHCLLIEAGDSLVLVDTGFGLEDARHPVRRLSPVFAGLMRPAGETSETAHERIGALGLDAADVREIVCTHLDLDHAGGLPDFPEANVHVFAAEHAAVTEPGLRERVRYPRARFTPTPRFVPHDVGGDHWYGFESVRILPGVDAEIALVPLPGHSRGHTLVAVNTPSGWLLHCGDAYFHRAQMATPPSCPPALGAFQRIVALDNATRIRNAERLRELARDHGEEITLFCSHDPVELERASASSSQAAGDRREVAR